MPLFYFMENVGYSPDNPAHSVNDLNNANHQAVPAIFL
jgi:hypothetical protein